MYPINILEDVVPLTNKYTNVITTYLQYVIIKMDKNVNKIIRVEEESPNLKSL